MKHSFLLKTSVKMLIISQLITASCKKDETRQIQSNKPPVAIAGGDITIYIPHNSVFVDGRTSHDPEGSIYSFAWRQISGQPIHNVDQVNTAYITIEPLKEGVYEFELKVTDLGGLIAKDTVKVTVIDEFAVDTTPVGVFLCDSRFISNTTSWTVLHAIAYVENNQGIRYNFSEGIKITQLNGPTQTVLKTPESDPGILFIQVMNLSRGTYTFKLEAERKGLKAFDTATIQVIDDTLVGKEYIFETKWEKDNTENAMFAKSPDRPDLFFYNGLRKTQIWIKTEGDQDWHEIFEASPWDYGADWFYFFRNDCESAINIKTHSGYPTQIQGKKLLIRVKYT